MAIDIAIMKMFHTVDSNGEPVRVSRIDYIASKTVDAITASLTTHYLNIASYYTPADMAYDLVTEADAVAWVEDLEDMAAIEAELDAKLGMVTAPTQYTGLPWVPQSPVWVVGVAYVPADTVQYLGIEYECVQGHTAQTTWPPDQTPALWKVWYPPEAGPQQWVQPLGAQDAYQPPTQVWWDAGAGIHLWECTIANNVWQPGVTGWLDLGSYTP